GGIGGLSSIAVDPAGDVVVGGTFDVATDFGGGILEPKGGRSGFLVRYSADGKHLWSRVLTRTADFVESVAIDTDGAIWVGGEGLLERYSTDGSVVEASIDFRPTDKSPSPDDPYGSLSRPGRLGT